jgi:hypothetical protein
MSNRSGTNIPESDRKTKRVQTRVHEQVATRLEAEAGLKKVSPSQILRDVVEGSWWGLLREKSEADNIKPEVVGGEIDMVAMARLERSLLSVSLPEIEKMISIERGHPAFAGVEKDIGSFVDGAPMNLVFEETDLDRCQLVFGGQSFKVKRAHSSDKDSLFGLIAACEPKQRGIHLLELVGDLRMYLNGSYSCYGVTTSMEALAVRWIRWRITDGWSSPFGSRLTLDIDAAFDDAVRTMAAAVCEMWDRIHSEKKSDR